MESFWRHSIFYANICNIDYISLTYPLQREHQKYETRTVDRTEFISYWSSSDCISMQRNVDVRLRNIPKTYPGQQSLGWLFGVRFCSEPFIVTNFGFVIQNSSSSNLKINQRESILVIGAALKLFGLQSNVCSLAFIVCKMNTKLVNRIRAAEYANLIQFIVILLCLQRRKCSAVRLYSSCVIRHIYKRERRSAVIPAKFLHSLYHILSL